MQELIGKESPRRRIARRAGAAGMALAAVLALGACDATGGGYIGAPLDEVVPVGNYTGDANFGFNFNCDAGIKGQITYHDDPSTVDVPVPAGPPGTVVSTPFPEIRLHGTVDTVLLIVELDDEDTPEFDPVTKEAESCPELLQGPGALFQGSYRSQDTTLPGRGRFYVQVVDMGEPSRDAGDPNGDGFSIELSEGPYPGYTRAGNIEGGNIQSK